MPEPALNKPGSNIAGWYGKIPALGDFISRRLPSCFINAWDAWLQRGLTASRASLKERWLEVYLNSPVWRFALLPGVCGDQGWVGVMMPSVDKVGRHFPLTIALALESHLEIITTLFTSHNWFTTVEQLVLSSLNMDMLPDDLERQLAENPFPILHTKDSISDVLIVAGFNLLARTEAGKSMWWCQAHGAAQLHVFAGFPPDHCFGTLLNGVACD